MSRRGIFQFPAFLPIPHNREQWVAMTCPGSSRGTWRTFSTPCSISYLLTIYFHNGMDYYVVLKLSLQTMGIDTVIKRSNTDVKDKAGSPSVYHSHQTGETIWICWRQTISLNCRFMKLNNLVHPLVPRISFSYIISRRLNNPPKLGQSFMKTNMACL